MKDCLKSCICKQVFRFLDLLILREDLSPSQLSVIQTEHSIMGIMFYYCLLFIKNGIIINRKPHLL